MSTRTTMQTSHVEGEFDRLKKQFHLLSGDKRAFYENTQAEIAENRDTITRYRTENEQLRKQVATMNRQSNRPLGKYCYAKLSMDPNSLVTKSDLSQIAQPFFLVSEHEPLERRVHHLREKLDDIKLTSKKRSEYLVKLEMDLSLKPKADKNNKESKKSRDLENRLDKALLKYKEAQAIRKTYIKVTDCLQKDRLTYDNRLAQLEKALKYKNSQYEELEVMARDAVHAKFTAKEDQQKFEEYYADQKKANEKELANLKSLVKAATEENVYLGDKKQSSKLTIESESAVDVEAQQTHEQMQMRLHEISFKKIKNCTGVSNINEVISKFQAQKDTQAHLLHLTEETKEKRDQSEKERDQCLESLNALKYAKDDQVVVKQKLEELEQKYASALAENDQKQEKMHRTEQLCIKTIVGVQHLTSKVTSKNAFDLASESIDAMKARIIELEDESKLTAEQSLELKRLQEIVKTGAFALMKKEELSDINEMDADVCLKDVQLLEEKLCRFSTKTAQAMEENHLSLDTVMTNVPRFNIRVDLTPTHETEDEDTYHAGEEDIMSREHIKKMSSIMVDNRSKKSSKKRSKR